MWDAGVRGRGRSHCITMLAPSSLLTQIYMCPFVYLHGHIHVYICCYIVKIIFYYTCSCVMISFSIPLVIQKYILSVCSYPTWCFLSFLTNELLFPILFGYSSITEAVQESFEKLMEQSYVSFCSFYKFFLFCFYFSKTYWKTRIIERWERGVFVYWFIPQMAKMAQDVPQWHQQPEKLHLGPPCE